MAQGDNPAGGLVELQDILRIQEKLHGPGDRATVSARADVAAALTQLGRVKEAVAQFRDLLQAQEKTLGPDNRQTLNTVMNLGNDLAESGEYEEAETVLRRAAAGMTRTKDDNELFCRYTLVMTLAAEGKLLEAEQEAREIAKLNDKSTGAGRRGWIRDMIGSVLERQTRHAEAEAQIRQALSINEKSLGPDAGPTLNSRGHLAKNLWHQGKNAEAETLLRQLIPANEKVLGAKVYHAESNLSSRLFDEPSPLQTHILLANTLRDQQKYAEAETEYKWVIKTCENALGREHHDTLNAYYHYAYYLAQTGKAAQAKAFAERTANQAVNVLGVNDPATREYAAFLQELASGHPITLPQPQFHDRLLASRK
jgi:tetratricopeptide (TPR) repeat protein